MVECHPGSLVTPSIELVRPLGSGGMGHVWVATHTRLGTEVAVKFISPEHSDKERFVARFGREATAAARIKSPHVVQVFDHGVTADRVPYIVMELLEGQTLAERLEKRRRMELRHVRLLVSQVAKVLDVAHGLGIVHRDLKPENLFLVDSGYELFVKVLDFGIAKERDEPSELTDTGAVVGTPYYMSPEMVKSSKGIDHHADLWALAVVAYRALTGKLPFRGETLGAIAIAINDAQFPPPSSLAPTASPDVDAWFKLALCRNIQGRFQSASELARAFRKATAYVGRETGDEDLPATARGDAHFSGTDIVENTDAHAATTPHHGGVDPSASAPAAASSGPTRTSDEQREREIAGELTDRDPPPGGATVTAMSEAVEPAAVTGSTSLRGAVADEPSERVSTLAGATAGEGRPRPRWSLAGASAAIALIGALWWWLADGSASPGPMPEELPVKSSAPAAAARGTRATADPVSSAAVRSEPETSASTSTLPAPPATAPVPARSETAAARAPTKRSAKPAPLASATSQRATARCNPPFTIDANGDYVPKPECFGGR